MEKDRKANIRLAIERMPKVELHVHLEGSVSAETIRQLAEKNGIGYEPEAAQTRTSPFTHFMSFLDSYRLRCKCLQEPDDFELACADVLRNLRSQNVRYVELLTPPTVYRMNGLSMDEVMEGFGAGVREVCNDGAIDARFIFDIGRQFGADHAWQTARDAARHSGNGVVALGLGGDEIHYSPELFSDQFAWARRQGLHLVAHAGEVTGSSSIWGAVESLGAERIDHGVGARGDDRLLEYLRVKGISLDMCPTSNVETGAVRSYADHPLPEFLRRGILVTLNSDDPAMFATSLTGEYWLCHERLGLTWEEIKTLCLNGVEASFLPDLDKKALAEEFEEDLSAIESDLELS